MTKEDKQIKRYLKSICQSYIQSNHTYSVYYQFENFTIRFSDHFSNVPKKGYWVYITKGSPEYYHFNIFNLQFIVKSEHILLYIKSMMLFLPEMINFLELKLLHNKNLQRKITELTIELDNTKKKYNEKLEEIQLFDDIYRENTELKNKNKRLARQLEIVKSECRKNNENVSKLKQYIQNILDLYKKD